MTQTTILCPVLPMGTSRFSCLSFPLSLTSSPHSLSSFPLPSSLLASIYYTYFLSFVFARFLSSLHDQVWDLLTIHELFSFTGKHARTRLFRPEGGVLDMVLDPSGWLYSCGADGTVKVLKLNMDHS